MHSFLQAWKDFSMDEAPFLLDGDELLVDTDKYARVSSGWNEYLTSDSFGTKTHHFQLGLVPKPFLGNPDSAEIFVLMLNPGFGPHDYFAEYQVDGFQSRMAQGLREYKAFPFLAPELSWHMGYSYWELRLSDIITDIGQEFDRSIVDARAYLAERLAVLQLVPYHSVSFRLSKRGIDSLRSISLARSYVNDVIMPRTRSGQCLVVCARHARSWGLESGEKVVVYDAGAARSASLKSKSAGGAAILQHLRSRA